MPYTLRVQEFLTNTLNVFISLIMGILGFRVLLKLLDANPSPFVKWIYEVSNGILYPFAGMFDTYVAPGGHIVEFSTLFAIAFYALVYFFAYQLLVLGGNVIKKRYNPPKPNKKTDPEKSPKPSP